MSAYLIDTKKIDVIVDAVFNGLHLTTPANLELAKSKLEFLGLPKEWQNDTKTAFGKRLLRTNVEALTERYPELRFINIIPHLPADLEEIVDQYEYSAPSQFWTSTDTHVPLEGDEPEVRALLALKELRYQCAEGRVIESAEYAGILALISRLESEIAEKRLRAYKKKYGIEGWG